MGKLETNMAKLKGRLEVVRRVTKQSVARILADCHRNDLQVRYAGLVVGSQIDPASIANPHIRAHALEGQLFRIAVVDALRAHGIREVILTERDAYPVAASRLRRSASDVRRIIQDIGRSASGPWRSEQKLAALAAWVAVS